MGKEGSAEERAARERFGASLREMEAAAAELMEVGDGLFRHGEPTDPTLLRRYQLYKSVKASAGAATGAGAGGGITGDKD